MKTKILAFESNGKTKATIGKKCPSLKYKENKTIKPKNESISKKTVERRKKIDSFTLGKGKNQVFAINSSSFKSNGEIISSLLKLDYIAPLEVKQIDPESIIITAEKLNEFDKAKLLARKYSKQCKVLRIIAKTKIKTKVQVDQVNRLVDLVKQSNLK